MNDLYNPCDDGFAAKVWECLRRNRTFRKILETNRQPNPNNSRSSDGFLASEENPWARIASWHLIPERAFPQLLPGREPKMKESATFNEETPWPETTSAFKSQYELIQSERARGLTPVQFPPFESIRSLFGGPGNTSDQNILSVHNWLSIEARALWRSNTVIGVPKQVFDTQHRKRLIAEFTALLSQPSADARWTKARGRLLGKKSQWQSFLIAEKWMRLGFDPADAANLTAFENYDQVHFEWTERKRLQHAKRELKNVKRHKRFSKVADDVRAVEACIASVYPDFTPMASV